MSRSEWDEAIQSKRPERLRNVLLKGYTPENLAQKVTVVTILCLGEEEELSIFDLIFSVGYINSDAIELAKKFIVQGVPLPEIPERAAFETCAAYFSYLLSHKKSFFITLYQNPFILNQQDEEGQTLLHHLAEFSRGHSSEINIITSLAADAVDLKITDHNGDTPLHIVAKDEEGYRSPVSAELFALYVRLALNDLAFDFNQLNVNGKGILHNVILSLTRGSGRQKFNKIVSLPQNRIDMNLLTTSGSTAFFYAVDRLCLDAAQSLLDHNADPTKCGNVDRCPINLINANIEKIQSALTSKDPGCRELYNPLIKQLTQIKENAPFDYAVKIYLNQAAGSLEQALELLNGISRGHPEYAYAQFLLGDITGLLSLPAGQEAPESKRARVATLLTYYHKANKIGCKESEIRYNRLLSEYYGQPMRDELITQFDREIRAAELMQRQYRSFKSTTQEALNENSYTIDVVHQDLANIHTAFQRDATQQLTQAQQDRLIRLFVSCLKRAAHQGLQLEIELMKFKAEAPSFFNHSFFGNEPTFYKKSFALIAYVQPEYLQLLNEIITLSKFTGDKTYYFEIIRELALSGVISAQKEFVQSVLEGPIADASEALCQNLQSVLQQGCESLDYAWRLDCLYLLEKHFEERYQGFYTNIFIDYVPQHLLHCMSNPVLAVDTEKVAWLAKRFKVDLNQKYLLCQSDRDDVTSLADSMPLYPDNPFALQYFRKNYSYGPLTPLELACYDDRLFCYVTVLIDAGAKVDTHELKRGDGPPYIDRVLDLMEHSRQDHQHEKNLQLLAYLTSQGAVVSQFQLNRVLAFIEKNPNHNAAQRYMAILEPSSIRNRHEKLKQEVREEVTAHSFVQKPRSGSTFKHGRVLYANMFKSSERTSKDDGCFRETAEPPSKRYNEI